MSADINEVLEYLSVWRNVEDIKKKFQLSQNEHYHLTRWLCKAKLVKKCTAKTEPELSQYDGRMYFYRRIDNK